MPIRLPPGGSPPPGVPKPPRVAPVRPRGAQRLAIRRSQRRRGLAEHHDEHEGHDVSSVPHLWSLTLQRVQQLNRMRAEDWADDEYPELEQLVMELLAAAERQASGEHANDPFGKEQALNALKRQARALLQSLQPPEEVREAFIALWTRLSIDDLRDQSSFARATIMNAKVRQDVMNRQVEEAVELADRLAAERRVEAIGDDEHTDARDGRGQSHGDGQSGGEGRHEGEATPGGASQALPRTLKQALKQLKKSRRTIGKEEAEHVAHLALEALRVLRDEVAPRWAPETQPWLIQTADTHVYQSVLAVIPEGTFRDTTAFEGIQRLRAGEHAFALRASEKLADALAREREP